MFVGPTEFKPWLLLEPENLKVTLRFPRRLLSAQGRRRVPAMVAREAWRTVAIATAGVALALLVAVPLTLAVDRGAVGLGAARRMHACPFAVRQAIRWLLILLRSVPELVWALVFVRVVGLGPTAGVLAIALTYSGMLGKVYGDILESGETHTTAHRCCATAPAGCRRSSTGCCRRTPPS
jgi:phosphonate transport system permease protein